MITNKIKLVIWDMDDTFWNGTISEGDVEIPMQHIACIKQLTDRGIMNSISSKNDYTTVKNKLEAAGIFDLFVFPKINWNAKGNQIKEIISQCNLRDVNVLFIDDNIHNLEEARFYCPDLNTEQPAVISTLLDSPFLTGNADTTHERLQQFKLLEKKASAREQYDSNEQFLYSSDIQVRIEKDCSNHVERLLDLINRSNQLNYTKIRLSKEELLALLADTDIDTRYITVKDNFGDYGIVGFTALAADKALHFLFSCRTIGLGVEQWVYAELGFPKLVIQGSVITELNASQKPGWINQSNRSNRNFKKDNKQLKVLIKGGCDLAQLEPYLGIRDLTCEFNYLNYHRDHTVYDIEAYVSDKQILNHLVKQLPFLYKNTFSTKLYRGDFDVIVLSLLMDYSQAVYCHKENPSLKVAYGNFLQPLTSADCGDFTAVELKWFFENFSFAGRISSEEFLHNLNFIREHIPQRTKLIVINGCEIPHENPNEKERHLVHRELNETVDRFVENADNTYLLDMRKLVHSRTDLTDNIRHYTRQIYFAMAQELINIMNSFAYEPVKLKHYRFRTLLRKIYRRIVR